MSFYLQLKIYLKIYFCKFQVPNYLPSISAASDHPPEVYVWRICIGVHSSLRFFLALVYYKFYNNAAETSPKSYIRPIIKFNFICKCIEVSSLVVLAEISSIENYGK